MSEQKIGIALSGGGVKGFAHLGVLKALEEKGIEADMISGTSAGAIVGSLIASGKKPMEIMELINESNFFDFAKLAIPDRGFLSLENMTDNLTKILKINKFSELKIPFYAAAANIYTGEIKYFNQGDLVKIVQASSSIPVLFSPVEINGQLYVDGGLFDNLPIAPLKGQCDIIIAVNVMPVEFEEELKTMIDVAIRTFQLKNNLKNEKVKKEADIYIEPEGIDKYNILNTKYSQELFDLGYNFCKKMDINLA